MPELSVVIPTLNSEQTIEKCLKAVRKSAFRNYELIVVDSSSEDSTCQIAVNYADKVINLPHEGRAHARSRGARLAGGEIIVNIDSDVIIKPDSLTKIHDYFSAHPEVEALTGLLSTEHPHPNFFSQYKNLYMHYIFSRLPDRVTFLYGSIYAIRQGVRDLYISNIKVADDTALGQQLVARGKQVAFLRDLEVVHLKKYNFSSWAKNDFQIPFDWAKIFVRFQGWKQMGKNKTGFAHASRKQLTSILIAPFCLLGLIGTLLGYPVVYPTLGLLFLWLLMNLHFLYFLSRERGLHFGIFSYPVTFLDHLIMGIGIASGFTASLYQKIRKYP